MMNRKIVATVLMLMSLTAHAQKLPPGVPEEAKMPPEMYKALEKKQVIVHLKKDTHDEVAAAVYARAKEKLKATKAIYFVDRSDVPLSITVGVSSLDPSIDRRGTESVIALTFTVAQMGYPFKIESNGKNPGPAKKPYMYHELIGTGILRVGKDQIDKAADSLAKRVLALGQPLPH